MKKIFFLMACIAIQQMATAQDLITKIPANANTVTSIHGAKLTSLLSPEEWDQSPMGKKLKEMMGKDSVAQLNSIKDIGLNLSGSFYHFNTNDDSAYYNIFLAPVANAEKLDQLFSKKEIQRLTNNVRRLVEDDSSSIAMWNSQQFIYVNVSLNDAYFQDSAVAARHGLTNNPYNYDNSYMVDTVAEATEMTVDTSVVTIEPIEEVAVDTVTTTIQDLPYDYEGDFDYYKDLSIKKKIKAACASFTAAETFYKTPAKNVLSNSSFNASNNAAAAASFWVDKPLEMYYRMMPYNYYYYAGLWNYNTLAAGGFGYNNFATHLLLNDQQLKLQSQVTMSDEMTVMQNKILDRKINKRFYKYINTDSMLGYMAWSVDTKAYLQQFPAFFDRMYGGLGMGISSEEYSLAAEFFSFLIDEEAIANMVKGDMMVLCDGVFQQETTYTDYTYDENYEQTAVEKTKNETLPRFLMMVSSEENNLARKLVKYGQNKSVVKAVDGFYEVEVPKSPMRFYFMYKDDVFFLTNSLPNIQAISKGNFKANISKSEKKMISNHNFSMYLNPKNISGQIASTEIGATEGLTTMLNTFNKMGEVRMKLNPIKNNIASAEMWMDVPKENKNALTLLFSFFENFLKF